MAIGQWLFVIALIPAMVSKANYPKFTCVLTAVVLSAYVPAMWTSGLVWASISVGLTATCWWILFIQGILRSVSRA